MNFEFWVHHITMTFHVIWNRIIFPCPDGGPVIVDPGQYSFIEMRVRTSLLTLLLLFALFMYVFVSLNLLNICISPSGKRV